MVSQRKGTIKITMNDQVSKVLYIVLEDTSGHSFGHPFNATTVITQNAEHKNEVLQLASELENSKAREQQSEYELTLAHQQIQRLEEEALEKEQDNNRVSKLAQGM